ncbi:MAG: tandem-95 repeat protein, partial [Rhodospirillaceae bacterium]|nr:tandem-95 repeat protein [Rhodospirillales bacterium]
QLGLASIGLGSTEASRYDNGNTIRAEGGFTFTDGATGKAAQVEFASGGEPDGNVLYVGEDSTTLKLDDGRVMQFVEGGTRLEVGGDIAVATGGGNTLVGGRDAVVMVSAGGDTLLGSAGNDLLVTRGGDNILAGGGGADRLQGGAGDDTYVFQKGDGADTITEGGGLDVLEFGAGITAANIVVEAVGDDLVVGVRSRASDQGKPASALSDRVVVKGGATAVESIKFADGTSWSLGMKVAQTTNGPRLVYDDTLRNDAAFWREALNAGGTGALASEMAAALAALAAGAAVMRPDLADATEVVRQPVQQDTQTALGIVTETASATVLSPLVLADLALPTAPVAAVQEKRVTAADIIAAEPEAPPLQATSTVTVTQSMVEAAPTPAVAAEQVLPVEIVLAEAVTTVEPVDPIRIISTEEPLPPNRPPEARDDSLSTDEDTPLTLSLSALLANDNDPEDRGLILTSVSNAVGGVVTLDGFGNVVFSPNANFNGMASFQYTISDEAGQTATATAWVTVGAVNDAPLVGGETLYSTEDIALTIAPSVLLANDSDIEGETLTVSAVGNAVGGTVALNGQGNVVFTPTADFNGNATFQYTVNDNHGGLTVATATVNVAAVNDASLTGDETLASSEDMVLTIAPAVLLANDVDVEGDTLSISAVGNPVGGTVALDGLGNVVFTPTANFNGAASFQYTVDDGQGGLAVATTTVNVAAMNDAPLVLAETIAGTEDTVLSIAPASLLANDSDIEGDTLSISAVGNAVGGTVALDGSGNVVFTPTTNFNGTASFQYTVSDGQGGLTVAMASVAVAAVNDAPLVVAETIAGTEDTILSIAPALLLANDTDIEGDTLSISAVSNAVGGTVALDGSGNVVFTPTANFNGAASFQYTVSDGQGGLTVATAQVNVVAVNDVPLVAGETVAGVEDTVLSIASGLLLANDSDIEGDTLSIIAVGNATGGTVALDGAGNVVFTPTANFNGAASFQYTVSDGQGGVTVATTRVDVAAVNDAPLVGGETVAGVEDTTLTIAPVLLLANDSDIEGDALSIAAVGNATDGTVALDGSGNVVFTPTANFNGAASFQYTVSDGQGGLTVATARVDVAAVNDAPAVTGELLAGMEDVAMSMSCASLLANDSDVDGDTLSISAVGSAVGGTVALDGLGNVAFTPTANYHGVASFDYTVSDSLGGETVSTAVIGLAAVNDAPVVVADSFTMDEDTSLPITTSSLLGNDSDVDGDTLALTGVSGATNGSVSLAGDTITYTPDANYYGAASFQYTLSDGQVSVTGTANITVNDVAEPSSGGGGGGGGGGGKPVVLDLDGDGLELTAIDEKSVLFDINDDGFLDKLGWVGGDDGLLAYDYDGNGVIEHGNEISFAQYLDGARTDLEGLKAFDSNHDGALDGDDAEWSKFGVWRDADGDGITDQGEFNNLTDMGIRDIGLASDWNSYRDHGNTVFGHASYSTIDGRTAIAGDVMLAMQDGKAAESIVVALPPPDPAPIDLSGQIASLKSLMAAYTGSETAVPLTVPDEADWITIALPDEETQVLHA